MKRQALAFIVLTLFFLAFVAFAISFGYASPVKKNRANTLGIGEVYTNPNRYLLASIIEGAIIRGNTDSDHYTNIRFQPYNTMSLYDETILFCGDQSAWFNGKRGPVVVTYETRAHKMFKGIACHELDSVFEVPSPEAK